MADHVAARDVDLVLQRQHNRAAGGRLGQVALGGDEARHPALAAGRGDAHPVAGPHHALRDQTRIAAELGVRPRHPLHRQPQGSGLGALRRGGGLQRLKEGRAGVPGRLVGAAREVGAGEARERDGRDLQPERRGEGGVVGHDALEHGPVPADQVHLVDRQHHPPHAHEVDEEAVAPRLGQQALPRVHQDHRQVRGGRPGDHVARVLLVPGCVRDNVTPPRGGEVAVGHVDGDALLALGGKTVDQEGEVEGAALRARLSRIGGERRQLVVRHRTRVVQQAADQGGLAVVHRPAGDEAQQVRRGGGLRQTGRLGKGEGRGQK